MKKSALLFATLFLSLFAKSQSNAIGIKAGNDEIKQIHAWNYLLGLNDSSSVFLWSDKRRAKIFMMHYDKEGKASPENKVWSIDPKEKGRAEISAVYEINKQVAIFLAYVTADQVIFYRVIVDPNTGGKLSEEKLLSYPHVEKRQGWDWHADFVFNCTKNDSLRKYYFMAIVKTTEGNTELAVNGYSYEHKNVSAFSKRVPGSYDHMLLLATIQRGNDYYFAVNYPEMIDVDKKKKIRKERVVMYKATNNNCEQLSFKLDREADVYRSYVAGQFSLDNEKKVRLALSYSYFIEDKSDKGTVTDLYVLKLSNGDLNISGKYVVDQAKLLNAYKNSASLKEKHKARFLNIPAFFYVNNNNRDEIVFHSCSGDGGADQSWNYVNDFGLFEFDNDGNVINPEVSPLNYELHYTYYDLSDFAFKYTNWENGRAFEYCATCQTHSIHTAYPNAKIFKHIQFINYKKKTFVFYNDLPENIGITELSEAKSANKINASIGMVMVKGGKETIKEPVFKLDEQVYFDFATASFNEKTGIYSVITYKKDNKVCVSYLSLK